jgi:hypothetical protein
MPRKSKIDAVADAKRAQKEAEERVQKALEELTAELGERLQNLFGMEEAHHAVVALEDSLKKSKKGDRIDRLKSLLGGAPQSAPSTSDDSSPAVKAAE